MTNAVYQTATWPSSSDVWQIRNLNSIGTNNAYPNDPLPLFQNKPSPANCDRRLVHSLSSSGMTVGLGDGSVRFVNANVSQVTWGRAIVADDGNVLGGDW